MSSLVNYLEKRKLIFLFYCDSCHIILHLFENLIKIKNIFIENKFKKIFFLNFKMKNIYTTA